MTEPPTLKEELDRKTMLALESLFNDLNEGRITHAQYGRAMTALWESVAGLVSKDIMDMFEAMPVVKTDDESYWQPAIVGEHMVRFHTRDAAVEVCKFKVAKRYDCEFPKDARSMFLKIIERLKK